MSKLRAAAVAFVLLANNVFQDKSAASVKQKAQELPELQLLAPVLYTQIIQNKMPSA